MKKSNKPFLSKQDFVGTGKVFQFTVTQMFKNKSNLVSLMIMFLFSLASVPFMTLVSGDSESGTSLEEGQIATIYYWNETEYDVDFDKIPERLPHVEGATIVDIAESHIEISTESVSGNETEESQNENFDENELISSQLYADEIVLHIFADEENGTYSNSVIFASEATDEVTDYFWSLADVTSTLFDEARYFAMGATEEQVAMAMGQYYTDVYSVDEYFDTEENGTGFETQFAVQYVYSIIVLILCMMASAFIIRSIIEEKASKLVELLMVSIQPLAMIVGKILAVMVYVVIMLLLMVVGCVVSNTITGLFTDSVGIGETLTNMGVSVDLLNLSPATIVIIIISLLLGYFTFSVVAGIAGASCSSMDDVESANMSVVFTVLAGYMVATITVAFESKALAVVTSLLPIVSIFCAPVHYVCNMINLPILILSWGLQAVMLVVLSAFAAKIYRDLIMHKGNRIKMKELFGLAFQKKTLKGEE